MLPWQPNNYVAIASNCRVVAWGVTENEARNKAAAKGHLAVMVVHAMYINNDNVTWENKDKSSLT